MRAITGLVFDESANRGSRSVVDRVKVQAMFLTTALVLSLGLPAQASAKDFPDKPYTLKTKGTTTKVKQGKAGTFALQIIPAKGYKVSREAPMKIKLKSKGLELEKKKLGQKDAQNKKSTSPKFNVGFKTPAAGAQSIDANAIFFICNEEICQRKVEKVKVAVSVAPQ